MTLLCALGEKHARCPLYEVDKRSIFDREDRVQFENLVSIHDFEGTPEDLEGLLHRLRSEHAAKYYKIATMARSSLDALRMLECVKKHRFIGLCMGELGQITRILAPIVGTPIMYAPATEELATAPGQLLIDELLGIYHFDRLKVGAPIYALIGDPVTASPGHRFHNAVLQGRGVYVKIPVRKGELGAFMPFVRSLPIHGLSVTIPHKEAIIPYLDEVESEAKAIGAVNTVVLREGRLIGYNTDGRGWKEAVGEIAGKRILVLGAGGTARAILYTALCAGATVEVYNRTRERAEALAKELGCHVAANEEGPYDLCVNTTPVGRPGAWEVSLLSETGRRMYECQAKLQMELFGY